MTFHAYKFPKIGIALNNHADIGSGSTLDHIMIDQNISMIEGITKNLPGYMEVCGSDHGWKDVLDADTVKEFNNDEEYIDCQMRSGHYMHIVEREELDEWHFHVDTERHTGATTINEHWYFDTKTEAKDEMRKWIQALSINPYIKSQSDLDTTLQAHDLIMKEVA